MKRFLPCLLLFAVTLAVWGAEAKPQMVRLDPTKASPGAKIILKPGQMLELSLQSNPTTGYDWQMFLPETEVLIRKSGEYRPDSRSQGLCGAGGTALFRFEAKKSGRTTLIGCYFRCWEPLDLRRDTAFTVSVEVTAPEK